MAEQSSFSTPGALQLADEYLTRRQQGLSARNELDSLLAAVSGEGFRNQQEKDAFTSLQQYIAQNAQDQSEIQAAERLSALLGPATKRQDDTPHYSFPEEQINVYQQSQADPANVAAMQSPQSQTGLSELIAMMSQSDQSPAMASESFDGASITGSQSGQSMESTEQLAKMQAAQKALGQSEAPIGDLISSIPVEEGQQRNFVMDEEIVRGGEGMTFSGMSKEPDLSGQTLAPLSPPSRGIMSTPEEQRNDLLSQYDMHQEEMRNMPRTLLGQIAPRDQAKFSHHKREADRALALLEGIDKGAAEKDAAFNMMDAAGISQEFPRIEGFDGSKTFDGMTMEADQSNFGKVMAPGTRGLASSQKESRSSPARVASQRGGEKTGEPVRTQAQELAGRSAENMIEKLIDKQSQGADLLTLMPSIKMFNEQLRKASKRDTGIDDLESRIKRSGSARDLFGMDAEVRNFGKDKAARQAMEGLTGAVESGVGSAKAHFQIENAKEKARGPMSKKVFESMSANELVGYERNHEDYLKEQPSVRIAYSNAIQKKLKDIEDKEKALDAMETAGRMDAINEEKGNLAIEKARLENQKLGIQIKKDENPSAKRYKASLTSAASMASKFLTDPYIQSRLINNSKVNAMATKAAREILRSKSDVDAGETYTKQELVNLQRSTKEHFDTLMRAFSGKTVNVQD